MKFKNPLLVVRDLEVSKEFYQGVLGLEIIADFGANVTFTGGVALQTLDSWQSFIEHRDIAFGGRDTELYFEEDDFDAFVAGLREKEGVKWVHPFHSYPWGQRVARFYDPDGHIIEVGESMRRVVLRFLEQGMTVEEAAAASQYPVPFVEWCREHPEEDPPEL